MHRKKGKNHHPKMLKLKSEQETFDPTKSADYKCYFGGRIVALHKFKLSIKDVFLLLFQILKSPKKGNLQQFLQEGEKNT